MDGTDVKMTIIGLILKRANVFVCAIAPHTTGLRNIYVSVFVTSIRSVLLATSLILESVNVFATSRNAHVVLS